MFRYPHASYSGGHGTEPRVWDDAVPQDALALLSKSVDESSS